MAIKYDENSIIKKTVIEHIRENSTMYLGGSTDLDADCQLLKEILDNAADESLPDSNKMYKIKVLIFGDKNNYQVCVIDNGRGIPCGKIATTYTEGFSSGKYNTSAYGGISTGTFGIGSKCTAALSEIFIAMTNRPDGFAGVALSKGKLLSSDILKPLNTSSDKIGTTVFYETDKSILEESNKYLSDPRGLNKTLQTIEYIGALKPNTKFYVYKIDHMLSKKQLELPYVELWNYLQSLGTDRELIYKTPDEMSLFIYAKQQFNIVKPTVLSITASKTLDPENDMDKVGYDVNVGITKDVKECGILGAVNFNILNNPTGSHIAVLQDRLKKRLVQYLDEDNKELNMYFTTEYNLPLHGYVSALFKNAKFINQSKDNFKNSDFARIYGASLDKWFDKEPTDTWEQLYDLIVDHLEQSFIAHSSKQFQSGKSLKNVSFKLSRIGSYIPCAVNNPNITELLITEGNSAGDSVKQNRDSQFQAVLKLRGKPINALHATADRLKSNDVYQDLIRLLGVGPHDKDLSNLNYNSIGLLADADPDGYHIVTLLIAAMYRINPLILESGKVWIANPPLYVHETKNKTLFLRDQRALDDARVEIYSKFFDIELMNLQNKAIGKLKNNVYRDFVYLAKRIGIVINDVANKLIVDPFVLEQLISCVDYLTIRTLNCEKIKEILNLEKCEYHEIADMLLLVSDGMEIRVPFSKLAQEIRAYILPELEPIHYGIVQPLVTTVQTDTYKQTPLTYMQLNGLFDIVDKAYPVKRLKGLGECTRDQLTYSCIDPRTRTYTTIRNIGDVDRIYQLLSVDTKYRKELAQVRIDNLIGEEYL